MTSAAIKRQLRAILGSGMLGVQLRKTGELSRVNLLTLLAQNEAVVQGLKALQGYLCESCPKDINPYSKKDPTLGDIWYVIHNWQQADPSKKGAITNFLNIIFKTKPWKLLTQSGQQNELNLRRKFNMNTPVPFHEQKPTQGGQSYIGQPTPSDTGIRHVTEKQGDALVPSNLSREQGKGDLEPYVHPDALMENQSLPKVVSIQDAMTDIASAVPDRTMDNETISKPRPATLDQKQMKTSPTAPTIGYPGLPKAGVTESVKPSQQPIEEVAPILRSKEDIMVDAKDSQESNSIPGGEVSSAGQQQLNATTYPQTGQGTGNKTTMGGTPGTDILKASHGGSSTTSHHGDHVFNPEEEARIQAFHKQFSPDKKVDIDQEESSEFYAELGAKFKKIKEIKDRDMKMKEISEFIQKLINRPFTDPDTKKIYKNFDAYIEATAKKIGENPNNFKKTDAFLKLLDTLRENFSGYIQVPQLTEAQKRTGVPIPGNTWSEYIHNAGTFTLQSILFGGAVFENIMRFFVLPQNPLTLAKGIAYTAADAADYALGNKAGGPGVKKNLKKIDDVIPENVLTSAFLDPNGAVGVIGGLAGAVEAGQSVYNANKLINEVIAPQPVSTGQSKQTEGNTTPAPAPAPTQSTTPVAPTANTPWYQNMVDNYFSSKGSEQTKEQSTTTTTTASPKSMKKLTNQEIAAKLRKHDYAATETELESRSEVAAKTTRQSKSTKDGKHKMWNLVVHYLANKYMLEAISRDPQNLDLYINKAKEWKYTASIYGTQTGYSDIDSTNSIVFQAFKRIENGSYMPLDEWQGTFHAVSQHRGGETDLDKIPRLAITTSGAKGDILTEIDRLPYREHLNENTNKRRLLNVNDDVPDLISQDEAARRIASDRVAGGHAAYAYVNAITQKEAADRLAGHQAAIKYVNDRLAGQIAAIDFAELQDIAPADLPDLPPADQIDPNNFALALQDPAAANVAQQYHVPAFGIPAWIQAHPGWAMLAATALVAGGVGAYKIYKNSGKSASTSTTAPPNAYYAEGYDAGGGQTTTPAPPNAPNPYYDRKYTAGGQATTAPPNAYYNQGYGAGGGQQWTVPVVADTDAEGYSAGSTKQGSVASNFAYNQQNQRIDFEGKYGADRNSGQADTYTPYLRLFLNQGDADKVVQINENNDSTVINRLGWQSFNNYAWESNTEPDNPLHGQNIIDEARRFYGPLDKEELFDSQAEAATQETYDGSMEVYTLPEQVVLDGEAMILDTRGGGNLTILSPDETEMAFHDVYLPPWTQIPNSSPWKQFTQINGTQLPDSMIEDSSRFAANDNPALRFQNQFIYSTES